MDAWLSEMTDAVLETLPLTQREVVRLARDEQLNEAEIADRLAIPQGLVASRLFRARMMVNVRPKAASKAAASKATKKSASAAPVATTKPLPTLQQVTKDLEDLHAVQRMIDGGVEEVPLPTLEQVQKDVEGLRAVEAMLDGVAQKESPKPAENPNAAMLKSIAEDRERLSALQAMLDEAAGEPEEGLSPVPDTASIRARIEEEIPGYTAAVQAAEQQLQQAKMRLATA